MEQLGEVASEYLSKGSPVFIEGRLQMDSWEDADGKKRSKLRISSSWAVERLKPMTRRRMTICLSEEAFTTYIAH